MAQPRFLFVAAESSRRVWASWSGEISRVGTPAVEGSWVAWRLAAGNNRELGRGASVFADQASCREAAVWLQRGIARAEPLVVLHEHSGLWGWRMDLDGELVAVAARLYRRQRECHYNLAQFTAAVPLARITQHVVVLRGDPDRPGDGPEAPSPGRPRAAEIHRDRVLRGYCAATGT